LSCQNYNFVINRGSTKVITVEYTDATGSIKDLTGYSARMQLRPEPNSSTISLSLSSTGSTANKSTITITTTSGSMDLYISAADTTNLTKDLYFYDLEIFTAQDPYTKTDPEYVVRLLEGTITTKYNVTR
jgi:hypothetical protein